MRQLFITIIVLFISYGMLYAQKDTSPGSDSGEKPDSAEKEESIIRDLSIHQRLENKNSSENDKKEGNHVIRDLSTHQKDLIYLRPIQQKGQVDDTLSKQTYRTVPRSVIETSTRLSLTQPEDGLFEKVKIINLEDFNKQQILSKLASHQIEGEALYINKELVEKLLTKGFEGDAPLGEPDLIPASELDTVPDDMIALDEYIEENAVIDFPKESKGLITIVVDEVGQVTKMLRITEEGTYEYYDGKKIVGGEEYEEYFKDGFKPITPTTFYYQLRESDSVNFSDEMQPSTFTSMPVKEQVDVINKAMSREEKFKFDKPEMPTLDNDSTITVPMEKKR